MKNQDESFLNFKDDVRNIYHVASYTLKDEESKIKDVEGAYNKANNNFEVVCGLQKGKDDD